MLLLIFPSSLTYHVLPVDSLLLRVFFAEGKHLNTVRIDMRNRKTRDPPPTPGIYFTVFPWITLAPAFVLFSPTLSLHFEPSYH